jgi:hypothetical protein
MWNRCCPLCFVKLSPFVVLSRSNDILCRACHAKLELSRHSRVFSSLIGVVFGLLAFHVVASSTNEIGRWIFPIFAAFLAYSSVSTLVLLIRSDLVVRHAANSSIFPHTPT